MNNKKYTKELQTVLTNIVDNMSVEFPVNEITVDYLIDAILNDNKCNANNILNTYLLSEFFNQLRERYDEIIRGNAKKNTTKTNFSLNFNKNDDKKVVFTDELISVLENSSKEMELINDSEIGSEHVLLSLLNPENGNNELIKLLKDVGIDYSIILNKCSARNSNSNDKLLSMKSDEKKLFSLPQTIKSDFNKKGCTQKTEYIDQYTISLNKLAEDGKIDELIGRKREVEKIIKVLSRRKKNNVILVGKGGCGKTQIVYGIAYKIFKNEVPQILQGKEIVMMDVMALVSGTHFRGMFEERVNGLFNELKASKNHILFIDDMQSILKSGSKDKDTDLSSMIGNILSEGDVRVIGTTTFKDYRNAIESNTSISRKLQQIVIEPTTKEETIAILNANKHYYEKYHNVKYNEDVIKKAVDLADRYITDRSLPDSAFDVIDLTGAYTCLIDREPEEISNFRKRLIEIEKQKVTYITSGNFEMVESITNEECLIKDSLTKYERELNSNETSNSIDITIDDIATSVSDMTNIPVNKLSSDEKEKISKIDDILKKDIIGQDDAIEKICRIIKRNKVGLGDKNKTLGNCLLLGPSGVGKTLIAKKLAEEIFGSSKDLVRIDMSEYSEKNSVAKLTGAAPGYVGYENGGQLTEAIKHKQHCVLLLDEIEKADQEVYNLFLQLFDEGRLTDSSGQVVNFKNVIVLMTSNIGAKQASELGKGLGFVTDESKNKKSIVEKQLKNTFTPEFINRIDQIVYFNQLTDDNLKLITSLEIDKLVKRINELGYDLSYDDSVVDYLFRNAIKEKEYGARPIIRLVQDELEDKITDLLLLNTYNKNYEFKCKVENGRIKFE